MLVVAQPFDFYTRAIDWRCECILERIITFKRNLYRLLKFDAAALDRFCKRCGAQQQKQRQQHPCPSSDSFHGSGSFSCICLLTV